MMGKKVATAIRFDDLNSDFLHKLSDETGLSVNWIVNQCVRSAMPTILKELAPFRKVECRFNPAEKIDG